MKNNKIITSWDKIEPSDSANDRMLSAILEKNRSVHDRKDKVNYMSQRKNFKKFLIPVAACLVAIVAVTGIVGSNMGWFGSKGYTVNLANGDSIVYHIGSTNVASIHVGYPVSSRKLTDAELDAILPETTERRSAIGTFREENGDLLQVDPADTTAYTQGISRTHSTQSCTESGKYVSRRKARSGGVHDVAR